MGFSVGKATELQEMNCAKKETRNWRAGFLDVKRQNIKKCNYAENRLGEKIGLERLDIL